MMARGGLRKVEEERDLLRKQADLLGQQAQGRTAALSAPMLERLPVALAAPRGPEVEKARAQLQELERTFVALAAGLRAGLEGDRAALEEQADSTLHHCTGARAGRARRGGIEGFRKQIRAGRRPPRRSPADVGAATELKKEFHGTDGHGENRSRGRLTV